MVRLSDLGIEASILLDQAYQSSIKAANLSFVRGLYLFRKIGSSGGTVFCFLLASFELRITAQEKAIRQTTKTMKSFLNISTTFISTLVSIKGSLFDRILATHRRQIGLFYSIFKAFWGSIKRGGKLLGDGVL